MKKSLIIFGIFFLLIIIIFSTTIQADFKTIRPNGQGIYSFWSQKGCIFDWECVNENPVDFTDYVFTYLPNAKESFPFSDVSFSSGEGVKSLVLNYVVNGIDDIILANRIRPFIRILGKEYFGDELVLRSSGFTTYSFKYDMNPTTNSPWEKSDINNLEAGVISSAVHGGGRLANIYAIVEYGKADLVSEPITFVEFLDEEDNLMVNITSTIKNIGFTKTKPFTTEFRGFGIEPFQLLAQLNIDESYTYSFSKPCLRASNFSVMVDYQNYIPEIDESNNFQNIYIDCII
jgi:hypothetical protein